MAAVQKLASAPGDRFSRVQRMLQVAVVLAALATIPVMIAQERGSEDVLIVVGDWTIWTIFLVEYLTLLVLAPDRRRYVRGSWLNLVVVVLSFPILPALLGVVRLVRLGRLLRVALSTWRALRALGIVFRRKGLVYVTSVNALLVVAGGGLLSVIEPETVKGDIGVGIWWAVVTATTVGYGDIAPQTVWGRLIGVALMLAGIGLVSTLAASIAAHFIEQEQQTGLQDVTARLDRIEALLRQQAEASPKSADGSQ